MTNHTKAAPVWFATAMSPYLWVAATLALGTTYTFMQTDDFCTIARLYLNSGHNPFRETWYMYLNWSGRYSAHFGVAAVGWIAAIAPVRLQWVYAASLLAFMAVFAIACLQANRLVWRDKGAGLLFATIIFSSTLAVMPSQLEGIFWLTGAAVYSFGIASLLLLMSSLATEADTSLEGRTSLGRTLWSMALIVITVGFNEFLGLMVGMYLGLRLLSQLRTRGAAGAFRWNIPYLVVFAVSLAVTVLAPGNFVRDSTISTQRHDLAGSLELAIASLLQFVQSHALPHMLLLACLATAATLAGWISRAPRRDPAQVLPVVLTLLLGFPMHLWVYTYLTGEPVPGRVLNQAYALALLGALMVAGWMGSYLATRRAPASGRVALAAIAVLGVVLVASPQFRTTATSIRDYGPTWKHQQLQRHKALKSAHGMETAVVTPIADERASPPIFQGADVTADQSYWVNKCVAQFYSVDSVIMDETGSREH